jgi:hypothetical protein
VNRPAAARLGAYVFVVAAGSSGMWRVETTARQAQDAAVAAQQALAKVEAEQEARQEQDCVIALAFRVEQEQLLVDMVTQLGGRRQVIDTIHQAYDALPEPASCEP